MARPNYDTVEIRHAAPLCTGFFYPKTAHETLANLNRVAVGRRHRRLVVDADGDQVRSSTLERCCNQAIEVCLISSPGAVCNTGTARDCDEIGRGICSRLRAGDLVDAVVPNDDREVLRRAFTDGCKTAKLHQQGAVAFEGKNVPVRLRNGNTKRDRYCEPHAAEHVEILRALTAGPKVEIGIADAADDSFLVFEPTDEPLGQFEAVHDLGVVRPCGSRLRHGVTPRTLCRP